MDGKTLHSTAEVKKAKKNTDVIDQAAEESATSNKPKSTNNSLKVDNGNSSDDSSLNLQTSDQILKEIVKNNSSAPDKVIEKLESKADDYGSLDIPTSDKNLKGSEDLTKVEQNNNSPPEPKGSRQKRKERIQKKIEENNECGKSERKSDLISTNSDLSIAIAMSAGRGKRAAASKSLEKTKDMYHNLPPLVEQVVIPNDSKKVKKILDNADPLVANSTEKSTLRKPDKKKSVAVKIEPDITSAIIKTENIIMKNYRIAFTGGDKEYRKPLETMIRKFGGSVVESWSDCTHLVTDKIRRTSKFLCALATGKFIMNTNWLEACRKNGRFIGKHSLN
jgi:hypothetical protein